MSSVGVGDAGKHGRPCTEEEAHIGFGSWLPKGPRGGAASSLLLMPLFTFYNAGGALLLQFARAADGGGQGGPAEGREV